MGSLGGHVLPGALFVLVGLWHTWCCVYRYVADPKNFRIRVWNPVPSSDGRLMYLELYVMTIGIFIDMCVEVLYSPYPVYFVDGVLNGIHMNNYEHFAMLLMFFIFGLITLISVKTRYIPLSDDTLCTIAAAAFSSEYLLFYFHSAAHTGLEGYYHFFLVLLVGLCIVTTLAGAIIPSSFPLVLSNSMAITLQGLWFFQIGLTLYGPIMPEGCQLDNDNHEIFCDSEDSLVRGQLLANFQLFSMLLGVFVLVAGSYCFASSKFGHSHGKVCKG